MVPADNRPAGCFECRGQAQMIVIVGFRRVAVQEQDLLHIGVIMR